MLVAVPAASPFKTLGDLLAHAKAHPEGLNYGTGGQGSAPHFATESFQLAADVKLSHIPYKGAGEAMLGLVGNQIDLLLVSTPSAVSRRSRAARSGPWPSAATSASPSHPDIPTLPRPASWFGVELVRPRAPAGTPPTSSPASTAR